MANETKLDLTATKSILVVDDEINLAEGIQESLQAEGYIADVQLHGKNGLDAVRDGDYDLIVLDVMLPGMDGFTICETLRQEGDRTPILFLTARGDASDRIRGLQVGGDDYLPKPFHLEELLLRVSAILRRSETPEPDGIGELEFSGNKFDFRSLQGTSWDGREHSLPHRESMIFKVLAERPGEVVSREEILEEVWGDEVFPSTRTIDNFIVRLRKRFEKSPDNPVFFHTVRGIGYRFTSTPERPESD